MNKPRTKPEKNRLVRTRIPVELYEELASYFPKKSMHGSLQALIVTFVNVKRRELGRPELGRDEVFLKRGRHRPKDNELEKKVGPVYRNMSVRDWCSKNGVPYDPEALEALGGDLLPRVKKEVELSFESVPRLSAAAVEEVQRLVRSFRAGEK